MEGFVAFQSIIQPLLDDGVCFKPFVYVGFRCAG
jgi:hypothetical protein